MKDSVEKEDEEEKEGEKLIGKQDIIVAGSKEVLESPYFLVNDPISFY